MNHHQVLILITVLATVQPQYQNREIRLISRLNNFYKFDHNIFLIDSSADAERFMHPVNHSDIVPISSYRLKTTIVKNTEGLDRLPRIDSKLPLMIVVIESGALIESGNSSLPARFVKMHRLHRNMKFGFFIFGAGNGKIQQLFRWCWNHGTMNVFIATSSKHRALPDSSSDGTSLSIFKFDPFGKFRVINITDNESVESIFPNTEVNFQLHPLKFPRQPVLTISTNEMQQIFCRAMNSTEITTLESDDIDIVPMLNTFIVDWHSETWKGVSLYPIAMSTFVLLVPEAVPYPSFSSYVQTVSSDHLFGWSIGTVAFLILLLTVTRYKKREWTGIPRNVVDVINLLMGDNSAIKYQKLLRAEATLIVTLTIAGFFMVNGISSTYQSYFTKPILQPRINTIDDLFKSTIPLFVTPGYYETEVLHTLNDQFKQQDWSSKIRTLNTTDLNRQIFQRNSSISFFTSDKGAQILIASQKRWSVRGYRVLADATALMKRLSSFYVNENFPFVERGNEIVLRTQSAGLFNKWSNDEIFNRSKVIDVDLNKDSDTEDFSIPFFVVHGWIAGCVVFGMEIFWKALSPLIISERETNSASVRSKTRFTTA